MQKRISLISFDNWHYDYKIVETLIKKGVNARHINLGSFRHATMYHRILNLFSKILLNKNLKHIKRQSFILEQLSKYGPFDEILVINPELIDLEYHIKIKQFTNRYTAYLYDSIARCDVSHLMNNIFDTIFSFDEQDCLKYGFEKINNYIYLDTGENLFIDNRTITTVSSFDNRFPKYNDLAYTLERQNFDFKFIIVGKNILFKKLKYNLNAYLKGIKPTHKKIIFTSKKMPLKSIEELYKKCGVILDLVQYNQSGLSFRVFESMALQKKLITDNEAIKKEILYNPTNILVIDAASPQIPRDFVETPYQPLPEDIYNEYTLNRWVTKVFRLDG